MKKKDFSFGIGLTISGIALTGIIVFVLFFAFVPRPSLAPTSPSVEHTETMPAVEVLRYAGVLPCDDCDGIRTEVLLRSDNTFRLTETRLENIINRPTIEIGQWTTLRGNARDLDATIYRINFDKLTTARNYLLLSNGNIQQIDEKQEPFTDAEAYILKKQ